MTPLVGFIIVTYSQPQQLLYLCHRLGSMFGDPPIAVHHDFSQCDLDIREFPANVSFVKQWVRTGWGSISVVDAQLAAMRLLYEKADPDWCVNLSGSDYPIQTGDQIMHDLRKTTVDAFLMLKPVVDRGEPFINAGLGELAFDHPRYSQSAFNRYIAIQLLSQRLARKLKQPREAWVLRSKFLIKLRTPFKDDLCCFGGDAWFTVNRRVVQTFLQQTPLWQSLYEHFRSRSMPEESFYHTLIGNTLGVQVSSDNLRYADWRGCYAHPRVLGRQDFPSLLHSTKHFARKFPFDPSLLAELDRVVEARDSKEWGSVCVPSHEHSFHMNRALP